MAHTQVAADKSIAAEAKKSVEQKKSFTDERIGSPSGKLRADLTLDGIKQTIGLLQGALKKGDPCSVSTFADLMLAEYSDLPPQLQGSMTRTVAGLVKQSLPLMEQKVRNLDGRPEAAYEASKWLEALEQARTFVNIGPNPAMKTTYKSVLASVIDDARGAMKDLGNGGEPRAYLPYASMMLDRAARLAESMGRKHTLGFVQGLQGELKAFEKSHD